MGSPGDVQEPAFARFLFRDARTAWLWLLVHPYLGYDWISAGWEKFNDLNGVRPPRPRLDAAADERGSGLATARDRSDDRQVVTSALTRRIPVTKLGSEVHELAAAAERSRDRESRGGPSVRDCPIRRPSVAGGRAPG